MQSFETLERPLIDIWGQGGSLIAQPFRQFKLRSQRLQDIYRNHNFIIDTIPSHKNKARLKAIHILQFHMHAYECTYEKSQVIFSKVSFFLS